MSFFKGRSAGSTASFLRGRLGGLRPKSGSPVDEARSVLPGFDEDAFMAEAVGAFVAIGEALRGNRVEAARPLVCPELFERMCQGVCPPLAAGQLKDAALSGASSVSGAALVTVEFTSAGAGQGKAVRQLWTFTLDKLGAWVVRQIHEKL